jgi:hypothetical protein
MQQEWFAAAGRADACRLGLGRPFSGERLGGAQLARGAAMLGGVLMLNVRPPAARPARCSRIAVAVNDADGRQIA